MTVLTSPPPTARLRDDPTAHLLVAFGMGWIGMAGASLWPWIIAVGLLGLLHLTRR